MSEKKTFTPAQAETWGILNAQHIGLEKNIDELVDNSLSAGAKHISVTLTQQPRDVFLLEVADDGCGFRADELARVFGLGQVKPELAGRYNQFGIGLKSVLASCDPDNKAWQVTSNVGGTATMRIKAPYSGKQMHYVLDYTLRDRTLAGYPCQQGTTVTVPIRRSLFNTLKRRNASDEERMEVLAEELAVTYAPVLDDVELTLEYRPLTGEGRTFPIRPLTAKWVNAIRGSAVLDLGRGPVQVSYTYGQIEPRKQAHRYYLGNIVSSGLEIFLDGRLIESNIFEEVWNLPHPSYNSFLFRAELSPDEGGRDALPRTTPEKDAMLRGDPCLDKLLDWVRQTCPDPKKHFAKTAKAGEVERCNALAETLRGSAGVESAIREMSPTLGEDSRAARTDIYVKTADGRSILLETKDKSSKVQDVAQLAAYGLMAQLDGLALDELVLVAKRHSEAVRKVAREMERHWFRDTARPKIVCITWEEAQSVKF